MDVSKIYNADLILSDHYTTLCMPGMVLKDEINNTTIDLEKAKSIVAALCNNGEPGNSNKITLYGVNDNNVWLNIAIPLIQYINTFNKTIITVQVEDDFLNEHTLDFCRKNSLSLSNVITKEISLDYIEQVLKYKPLTKFVFNLAPSTINNFWDIYTKLQQANCQNFDIQINEFETWTEADFINLYENLDKLFTNIGQLFRDDEIPLVPKSFERFINRLLVQDYDIKHNKETFEYFNLLNTQCGFTTSNSYCIDQEGKVYTCCKCIDELLCGKFNFDTEQFDAIKDEFDIFNVLYPDILNITKSSAEFNCSECDINSICIGSCYSINYTLNKSSSISSSIYCKYNKYIYNKLVDLVMQLDSEKNELLRDFIYGCSFKGYFNYDR